MNLTLKRVLRANMGELYVLCRRANRTRNKETQPHLRLTLQKYLIDRFELEEKDPGHDTAE